MVMKVYDSYLLRLTEYQQREVDQRDQGRGNTSFCNNKKQLIYTWTIGSNDTRRKTIVSGAGSWKLTSKGEKQTAAIAWIIEHNNNKHSSRKIFASSPS